MTLGTQLLPQRVVSATITSSPHFRILVRLLGLTPLGTTDGATLSICYLPVHPWPGQRCSTLLRDDLFRVCYGPDHAEAVVLTAFLTDRVLVAAATACVFPFLLAPPTALGCISPWHMKGQCLDLIAAFVLGLSSAVWTRQHPTASVLARFRMPAWSSVQAWLPHLRTGSDSAPQRSPMPDPVLHVSAPLCRGAVADARLGLA